MLTTAFLKQEKYKILATFLVAGFFLYFWLEGPLQQTEPIINLDPEATEFSKPKFVGDNDGNNPSGFGTVGDAETEGFGHGIMLDKPKETSTSGILTKKEADLSKSREFTDKLMAHARKFIGNEAELKANEQMFYVESQAGLIYMESRGLVKGIRGYAGEINVGIVVSEEGHLESVYHVSSKETESYLKKVANSNYYDSYEELPLKGEHEIDAISGATLTTEAISKTVTALAEVAMPEPLVTFADASEMRPFNVSARLSWWWIVHISVIFLMFFYGFQKKIRKTKKGLIILSLISVGYIGFFLNNSFTYVTFLHPFLGTSVSSLVGLYALFTLLGAIWGKNTYCKYVCPFGNAQRLVLQFSPKKARAKFFIPNKWVDRIRDGIALVLIIGLLLGLRSFSNFELFPDLFGLDVLAVWFVVALLTVFFTARYPMIWCRLLCPTGSVLDFISEAVNVKKKKRKVN